MVLSLVLTKSGHCRDRFYHSRWPVDTVGFKNLLGPGFPTAAFVCLIVPIFVALSVPQSVLIIRPGCGYSSPPAGTHHPGSGKTGPMLPFGHSFLLFEASYIRRTARVICHKIFMGAQKAAAFAAALNYSITTSNATMMAILITMEMELMALDSPTSPFSSPVNTGIAEPMGAKLRITRVCRTPRSKGSRK